MNTTGRIARIVPCSKKDKGNGPTKTQGTRVMIGDIELVGVTGIELYADLDDVWRAKITCQVMFEDEISVEAEYEVSNEK